jgi:hypothetical protein
LDRKAVAAVRALIKNALKLVLRPGYTAGLPWRFPRQKGGLFMDATPAEGLFIVVLCPQLAPEAHGPWCSFRHLFLTSRPDRPGDWCGTVTDLDQVRGRFPGVLFHKCLLKVLEHGISQANAIEADPKPPSPALPPPIEGERRQKGGHPYGRS